MTTEEALLKAVLANPADDLPRLVSADWLDENGDPDRAEFIRVQCRMEAIRPNKSHPTSFPEWEQLVARNRDLMTRNAAVWCPFPLTGDAWRMGPVITTGDGCEVEFNRGFISEARCKLDDWCGSSPWYCGMCQNDYMRVFDSPDGKCHNCRGRDRLYTGIGPAVVRRHPVERVVLTDREPSERNGLWFWYFDSGETGLPSLPATLNGGRREQRWYGSCGAAADDASRRVIAWAKSQIS